MTSAYIYTWAGESGTSVVHSSMPIHTSCISARTAGPGQPGWGVDAGPRGVGAGTATATCSLGQRSPASRKCHASRE
ncbi:uncharacterized protein K452DRAFT_26620 [Aplosporella prunicola CBS 121167]|uniref:Uncharacterized protein n=1 Tax=Aplosporella prunicola CBS 121167 TaxID=1176127 RepID=A0A6A6BHS5_9PEZI|nr:uncharacterized protein K452DRAFT_26620 [Aplosporella prunicola CBS 121167]KAF2142101.1 hypothetical protein K452DRAFT_26620 [Aplosporella prunicola CBS 121167]